MQLRRSWGTVACFVALAAASMCLAANQPKSATIESRTDRLVVNLGGQVFAEYVFTNTSRPFCYPIYGPGQVPMTRNWPMKEVKGEQRDHPHHKGMWYAHGAVNGIDFWSEVPGAGTIRHKRFIRVDQNPKAASFETENEWLSKEGKLICTDTRSLTFRQMGPTRVIDFEITLNASEGPVTLGDTKEGTMAIRIAESMRLKGGQNTGHIVNSKGVLDDSTWGKSAEWCAYSGPVDGNVMSIAILDHPSNPRHPTWWHVRDYGLFAANPFGRHDFEKLSDPKAGDLRMDAGSSLTFKYRFIFAQGAADTKALGKAWKQYAGRK